MRDLINFVAGRGIDKLSSTLRQLPITRVNMAEDVRAWFDALHNGQQLFAPHRLRLSRPHVGHHIKNAVGRAVRNQHVRVVRNQLPLAPDFAAPIHIEGPIEKTRLPGRAVNFQTLDLVTLPGVEPGLTP